MRRLTPIVLLTGAAALLGAGSTSAQTAQAASTTCSSAWSNGFCWINADTVPPSMKPPDPGEAAAIIPGTTTSLDVSPPTLLQLAVLGTLNQAENDLTAGLIAVSQALGFSGGVYNLSGGTVTATGGAGIFGEEISGTFNQTGGTNTVTKGVSLNAPPSAGLPVQVGGTGTYNLSDGTLTAGGLSIGNGTSGGYSQSGGTAEINGPVVLGGPLDPAPLAGGQGTVSISGGEFTVKDTLGFGVVLGGTGTGTFAQTDGTVTIKSGDAAGGLVLGRSVGGSGAYLLSGGELNVDQFAVAGSPAFVIVGQSGTGVFTQTGGSNQIEGTLTLGANPGSQGTYNLSGASALTKLEAENEVIQNGTFNQTGGSNSVDMNVAGAGGGQLKIFANGTYNLSAGLSNDSVLTVEDRTLIQGGTFNQTGGSVMMDGALAVLGGGNYFLGGVGSSLTVGDDVTITNSQFTQTGGNAQFNGALTLDGTGTSAGSYSLGGLGAVAVAGDEVIGDGGLGNFTQTAGTNSISGNLTLGNGATGQGTYTLSGTGILSAGGNIVVGMDGSGLFTQSGGSVSVFKDLTLGADATGNGIYNLSDGKLNVTGNIFIGAGSNAFNQTGGSVTVGLDLRVAPGGSYALTDGSLAVSANEVIGNAPGGTGSFTQNSGDNTVSGTLVVGSGGVGVYTLTSGLLHATNEIIGATGGTGTFNQAGGVNTVVDTLTVGGGPGSTATYNLMSGIINAGDPKNGGLVNNAAFNVTGVSFIQGNVTNNVTGTITVTGAILNVKGDVTNFGAIILDPSTLSANTLSIGATGYLVAGHGDVVSLTGDFLNMSTQNTLWNTDAAELDFTGGGSHLFALAGHDGGGFANDFAWGTIRLGAGDSLDLELGSGDALYVNQIDGLDISGDLVTNIVGAPGLFLYFNPADTSLQQCDYMLEGGGELTASGPCSSGGGGGGGPGTSVPEPSTLTLCLVGILASGLTCRRRRLVVRRVQI